MDRREKNIANIVPVWKTAAPVLHSEIQGCEYIYYTGHQNIYQCGAVAW